MERKVALIVGATGAVGRHLLQHLLSSNEYSSVIALVRRGLEIEHPKLEERIIKFEELEHLQMNDSVNDVFCCLGTTIKKAKTKQAMKKIDVDYPLLVAGLSRQLGAEKFLVVSAVGANVDSRFFYSRLKGLLEDKLKLAGFNTLYLFQPSLLLGERNEFRLGEVVASKLAPIISPLLVGRLKKYKPIEVETVAHAMVTAAQRDAIGNFILHYNQIQALAKKGESK